MRANVPGLFASANHIFRMKMILFSLLVWIPRWSGPHSKHHFIRRRTCGPSRTFSPQPSGFEGHKLTIACLRKCNRTICILWVWKWCFAHQYLVNPQSGRTTGPPPYQIYPSNGSGPQVPTNRDDVGYFALPEPLVRTVDMYTSPFNMTIIPTPFSPKGELSNNKIHSRQ